MISAVERGCKKRGGGLLKCSILLLTPTYRGVNTYASRVLIDEQLVLCFLSFFLGGGGCEGPAPIFSTNHCFLMIDTGAC